MGILRAIDCNHKARNEINLDQKMRETSIISIIRRYGLNSKKLSDNYRIKFRDTLTDFSVYNSDDLGLVEVVDNASDPDRSLSDVCMVRGCGKRIRYEYHLLDKRTDNLIVCGSSCCCTLLGLSKLQQKSFKSIETALKEKKELEEWKKNNPDIIKKLEKLNCYDLPFYKPFINEIAFSALTKEDTEFISKVNTKLLLSDLKHLDILNELLDYDPKAIYRSIRDHVLVKGKYLSGKQKEFIEKEYETLLKKRNEVAIVISNGYEFKEYLKEDGYSFNPRKKNGARPFLQDMLMMNRRN